MAKLACGTQIIHKYFAELIPKVPKFLPELNDNMKQTLSLCVGVCPCGGAHLLMKYKCY